MKRVKSEEERQEKRDAKQFRRFARYCGILDIDEELDKKYYDKCTQLRESIQSEQFQLYFNNEKLRSERIAYFEYGISGDLHRGFYCPSPILDIVAGNCKRGRRAKQKKEGKEYNYEYGFDKDGRLVRVRQWLHGKWASEEMLVYDGDTCLSCWPDRFDPLSYIWETVHKDGKIISYKMLYTLQGTFSEYHEERYEYNEMGLEKAYWNEYRPRFRPHSLTEQAYHFQHDEEGYLSTYYMKYLYENPLVQGRPPEPEEPNYHKVYLKRKI